MEAIRTGRPMPMTPGGPLRTRDDEMTQAGTDVVPPARTVAGVARSVLAVLVREGLFVAVTILLVLFLLPAALGAAGPVVVGG